jgi:hypothetical protein
MSGFVTVGLQPAAVRSVAAATYTLQESDLAAILMFTNAGGCTVTVPDNTLPAGWSCAVVQRGAAVVTFVADGTLTFLVDSLYATPPTTREVGSIMVVTLLDAGAGGVAKLYGELALA